MASLKSTTDLLLRKTVNRTLEQFITEHYAHGGDQLSLQAALAIATGQVYDRRTVARWVNETGTE